MNPSKKSWYLLSTLLIACFVAMHGSAVSACCSLLFADFTNTVGFVSEIEKDGKTVHVLAYQNVAQNMAQGDFVMKTADVRRGILEPIRALPPGADEAKSIWSESKAHRDANTSSRISSVGLQD